MSRRLRPSRPAILLAGAAALPGVAEAAPLVARYEVEAAGLTVMHVEAAFDLDAPGDAYRISARIRTGGVAGVFSSASQVTSVEGRWQGLRPAPVRYRVDGTWRGRPRRVAMDYPAPGAAPAVLALEPPNEAEREPVPAELQRGTVDGLSAIAALVRTVARTGRCDAGAATFDGRRRTDYLVRTAGAERLPAAAAPAAGGEALRCTLEARLVAGILAGQDPAEARRPHPASAWLARVEPAAIPVPVRIELPSRWFGTIRVRLVGLESAAPRDQFVQQGR